MSRFINPVPQFWLDNGTVAASGKMEFYENGDYSTLKNTYADPLLATENTNPVNLDGQGRMPSCFGQGLYSVKLYAYDNTQPGGKGTLQWTRDDVDLTGGTAGAFDDWSPVVTYSIGAAVKDEGKYYLLYGSPTSKGERPSDTPTEWEQIAFLTVYNPNKIYSEDEIVVDGGFIYRSLENDNEDSPPSAKWANLTFNDSVADDFSIGGNLDVTGNSDVGGSLDVAGPFTAPGHINTYFAKKSTGQTVTASTTLVDSAGLSITLANGAAYHIRAHISWNAGATTANGIKITFTGASVVSWMWIANSNASTANANPTANASGGTLQFTKMPNAALAANETIVFDAIVTGTGSAFKAQFAQAVSDAIGTTMNASSCIIATRLG